MIWLLVALVLLALGNDVLLFFAGATVYRRIGEVAVEHDETHAKCMSMVAAFVGDEFAAQVLMAAADDYDTAEGQSNLRRMVHTVWVDGGPSMPSLWLRDRAESILDKSNG